MWFLYFIAYIFISVAVGIYIAIQCDYDLEKGSIDDISEEDLVLIIFGGMISPISITIIISYYIIKYIIRLQRKLFLTTLNYFKTKKTKKL